MLLAKCALLLAQFPYPKQCLKTKIRFRRPECVGRANRHQEARKDVRAYNMMRSAALTSTEGSHRVRDRELQSFADESEKGATRDPGRASAVLEVYKVMRERQHGQKEHRRDIRDDMVKHRRDRMGLKR